MTAEDKVHAKLEVASLTMVQTKLDDIGDSIEGLIKMIKDPSLKKALKVTQNGLKTIKKNLIVGNG